MQQVLTPVKPQGVGTKLALDEIAETVLKSGVGVATVIVYHLVESMNHLKWKAQTSIRRYPAYTNIMHFWTFLLFLGE